MESTNWLRLVIVGIVLAALALGYFLISNNFFATKPAGKNTQQETTYSSPSPTTGSTPQRSQATPTPTLQNQGSTTAYDTVSQRYQNQVTTLPNTGSPLILLSILSASAMLVGLGLRKFPH